MVRTKNTAIFRSLQIINKDQIKGVNSIHTSAILYSNSIGNINQNLNRVIDNSLILEQTRLDNLQVVKYESEINKDNLDSLDLNITEFKESFPWLMNEEGKAIDYNKPFTLFNGVKLVSKYLQTRYLITEDKIQNPKISEFLEIFNKEKGTDNLENVTILELYEHVSKTFNTNKDMLINSIATDHLNSVGGETVESLKAIVNSNKPFGSYGDITINELANKLKDLNWNEVLNKGDIIVNTLPVASGLISLGFLMRGYVKYVHNRPFPTGLNQKDRSILELKRIKNLYIFALIGTPILIGATALTALNFKDLGSIHIPLGSSTDLQGADSNNIINKSGSFFLLISTIYNKIPVWLRFSIQSFCICVFLFKLIWGGNLSGIFNLDFIRIYTYIVGTIAILFELLELLLIYLFSKKYFTISEFLPNFIINWLKGLEILSKKPALIQSIKDNSYLHIVIYMFIIIIVIFIT